MVSEMNIRFDRPKPGAPLVSRGGFGDVRSAPSSSFLTALLFFLPVSIITS